MTGKFDPGIRVFVREIEATTHVRTPHYVRGKIGTVIRELGSYRNPEQLAYGADGMPLVPLYHVSFSQHDLWPDYAGERRDTAIVEIYEHWLEQAR